MSHFSAIHNTLEFFTVADLAVTPWRNGGGETREILSIPDQASDFNWRASIATIAEDGPFSLFPGIDRSITLLSGEGVHLFAEGKIDHALTSIAEPFAFSGDVAVTSRLLAGTTTDFNIMTRRGTCRAVVSAKQQEFCAPLLLGGVLLVLRGEWLLQGENGLSAQQGVVWSNSEDMTLELLLQPQTADALLIWAAILPL